MTEFYQAFRPQVGRPRRYKPKELLEKFDEYLAWVKANPVEIDTEFRAQKHKEKEKSVVSDDREATLRKQKLLRPVSIRGFLVHIGMSRQWWDDLGSGLRGAEFLAVKSLIKGYCEQNQLDGAMLGLYNGNIVSRLLGLKEREEVEHSGKVEVAAASREELLAELERLEKLSK